MDVCYIREFKNIDVKDEINVNLTYANADQINGLVIFSTDGFYPDIDYVPNQIFTHFPNLSRLSFKSKLNTLSPNSFKNASKLKQLTMGSEIKVIERNSFAEIKHLKELTLSSNKISNIVDHTFGELNELFSLSLDRNRLTSIHRNTFAGLSMLEVLDLDDNEIDAIEEGALDLPNIKLLYLSGNKLKTLADTIFQGLQNLITINLNRNQLEYIGQSFYVLSNVKEIRLEQNQIHDIDLKEFAKFQNLIDLSLENSGFSFDSNWANDRNDAALQSPLIRLNLGENGLTNFTELINLRLFPKLEVLTLSDNLYTNIAWDMKTIKNIFPNIKKINLRRTKIDCNVLAKLSDEMKPIGIEIYFDYTCVE